ncbi:hypothetical protein L873DRAFT_1765674 [Choiromyces venosus 120613-1]|uniref:Uncharacterized protein n=1 Tax=Choiromyces venosus 120613-1 TaxID=1336337 RepID=A0A3N4JUL9_9PEZI|nr:hypothetical protein L873DRAFT_1765674 [Choiromyces venosus 120613-1]
MRILVAKEFCLKIHCYRNIFTFTSLGVDERILGAQRIGVYSFQIKGALYYQIGSLLPNPRDTKVCPNIYSQLEQL